MVKNFCDCCQKEIDGRVYRFNYQCHLDPSGKWLGYSRDDGEPYSGRDESKDVCLYCYNRIMSVAVAKFTELSKTTDNTERATLKQSPVS